MPEFSLPHDHGAHGHTEDLYRELKNVEHFGAVCDIFNQLSDPTRVRIFWLLSHREGVRHQHRGAARYVQPRRLAPSAFTYAERADRKPPVRQGGLL